MTDEDDNSDVVEIGSTTMASQRIYFGCLSVKTAASLATLLLGALALWYGWTAIHVLNNTTDEAERVLFCVVLAVMLVQLNLAGQATVEIRRATRRSWPVRLLQGWISLVMIFSFIGMIAQRDPSMLIGLVLQFIFLWYPLYLYLRETHESSFYDNDEDDEHSILRLDNKRYCCGCTSHMASCLALLGLQLLSLLNFAVSIRYRVLVRSGEGYRPSILILTAQAITFWVSTWGLCVGLRTHTKRPIQVSLAWLSLLIVGLIVGMIIAFDPVSIPLLAALLLWVWEPLYGYLEHGYTDYHRHFADDDSDNGADDGMLPRRYLDADSDMTDDTDMSENGMELV